jgi:hypothetical protein
MHGSPAIPFPLISFGNHEPPQIVAAFCDGRSILPVVIRAESDHAEAHRRFVLIDSERKRMTVMGDGDIGLNDADIKGGKMIETGGNYSSAIFMNTG